MADERNIALFVKLNFGEIYASSVRATLRQFRVVLLIFGIMTALWGLLLLAVVFHPRPGADWYEMMHQPTAFPWLIAGACFVVFILPLLTAWKLTQDPRIRAGCRYSFSDSGMEFENSSTRATVNWTGFVRAEESGSAFLLFPNKVAAHILPKRCFTNEADLAAMRDLLRANVPNAKLQRS
jgi:hypothetical protein